MTHIDEQSLLLLLKSPKKKYIKHLLEYSAGLYLSHGHTNALYTTPLIQSFQADMELTTEEAHKLLLALTGLVARAFGGEGQVNGQGLLSEGFDEQLRGVLLGALEGVKGDLGEIVGDRMRMGNKMLDIEWKLDLQIANEKGKSNIPRVCIQIQSVASNNSAELQVHKIQMKGEQFKAFFANLKKIKQNLNELVGKNGDNN